MTEPTPLPDGRTVVNGRSYMADAKGALVPIEMIRKIVGYAVDLSAQVGRFKQHTFDDLGAFEAILAQEYGATKGGAKGNKTFMSHDGLYKVQVAVADYIDFGPQLQIAKELVYECLNEWSADARPELRALVTNAFRTDKEGQINRSEIFMLLRLEIEDERWNRAMDAIRAAMRVVGSKIHCRCYSRKAPDAAWTHIPIDVAKV